MNLKNNFIRDEKSKSLSFFNRSKKNIPVTKELMEEIKLIAFKSKVNVRVNLHLSSDDDFHNMLIFQWKGTYIRPHKHKHKAETCHMIEGEQQQIILSENGKRIDNCNLSREKNIIYRIDKNTYHTAHIISEYVLFHESKPGPFLFENDSIFPKWAPSKNYEEVNKFMNSIFKNSL